METYRVIRTSEDFGVVVVVSPENADPGTTDATYFIHNPQRESLQEPFFRKTTSKEAQPYFSGTADGLGFGELPSDYFTTLDDVEVWAKQSVQQAQDVSFSRFFSDPEFREAFIEVIEGETMERDAIEHLRRVREILVSPRDKRDVLTALEKCPAARKSAALTQEIRHALAALPHHEE